MKVTIKVYLILYWIKTKFYWRLINNSLYGKARQEFFEERKVIAQLSSPLLREIVNKYVHEIRILIQTYKAYWLHV